MSKVLMLTVDVEEWFHSRWFDVDEITNNPPLLCEEDLGSALDFLRD